jgi:hypothetical protein
MGELLMEDQQSDALAFDLWGPDETPYKCLSDKIIKARKDHRCHHCKGAIVVGSLGLTP